MAASRGGPVLLVGFDGLDWKILQPLLDRGELPNFARLIKNGASGRLATLQPTLSPILWNSIASGKRAGKHGIHGFTEVNPDTGTVRPVSSTSRTCKAVWNILQQSGRRVNVINWFAGHPAEPLNGVAVSPLFFEGNAGAGTLHPAELAATWADLRVLHDEVDGEIGRLFVRDIAKVDQDKDPRLGQLASELAKTFSIQATALEAMQRGPWDFTAVYFRFTDILAHIFMPFHPPKLEGVPEELFHHYQDVVNSSYRLADLLLAHLCHAAGPTANVLVLSDHGFASDTLRPKPEADPFARVEEWHRQHGVLIAAGPGFRPGATVAGAGLLDITPTLLALFGLPLARDFDGRALLELLASSDQPAWIESWETMPGDDGRHPAGVQLPEADSAALLKQLEALGYIAPLGTDKEAAARQTRYQNTWNLARDFIDGGHDEAALPLLEQLHVDRAQDIPVTLNLALCQSRLGLADEARLTAGDALRLTPEGPMLHQVLARLATEAGKTAEALDHYAKAIAAGAVSPALHLDIGRLHLARREWAAAEASARAALALDEDDPFAWLLLARVALLTGAYTDAVERALGAVDRQQNLAMAHLVLGRALVRLGRDDDARAAFQTALVYEPKMARAHQALGNLSRRLGADFAAEARHRIAAEKILRTRREGAGVVTRLRAEAAARRAAREAQIWAAVETVESAEEKIRRDVAARTPAPATPEWTLPPEQTFVIVSGLPRSGTSLMMQMLTAGGMAAMSDGRRQPDDDNPRGYFEWEQVRDLPAKPWLIEQAAGKVTKVVSPLLTHLPRRHRYRIIFMERAAGQLVASQAKMLERRGGAAAPDLEPALQAHAESVGALLRSTPEFEPLVVPYAELVADPAAWTERVRTFLAPVTTLEAGAMIGAVRPELYRNR